MSGSLHSWYSLPDLAVLAGRGVVLEGTIPLERLGRLKELLNSSEGDATARITIRKSHDDMLLMELQMTHQKMFILHNEHNQSKTK